MPIRTRTEVENNIDPKATEKDVKASNEAFDKANDETFTVVQPFAEQLIRQNDPAPVSGTFRWALGKDANDRGRRGFFWRMANEGVQLTRNGRYRRRGKIYNHVKIEKIVQDKVRGLLLNANALYRGRYEYRQTWGTFDKRRGTQFLNPTQQGRWRPIRDIGEEITTKYNEELKSRYDKIFVRIRNR